MDPYQKPADLDLLLFTKAGVEFCKIYTDTVLITLTTVIFSCIYLYVFVGIQIADETVEGYRSGL